MVVGTDRPLRGLRAVAGDLKHADGSATLPASAIATAFAVSHPVTDLGYLSRGGRDPGRPLGARQVESVLRRHGPPDLDLAALSDQQKLAQAAKVGFFDHIGDPTGKAPATARTVPGGSAQPIWLTRTVPPDAAPGTYRGSVRVVAEEVEAEAEVAEAAAEPKVIGEQEAPEDAQEGEAPAKQ